MHHYADDISFTSPFVTRLNNDPSGSITTKPDLQQYFLRFNPQGQVCQVHAHYTSP